MIFFKRNRDERSSKKKKKKKKRKKKKNSRVEIGAKDHIEGLVFFFCCCCCCCCAGRPFPTARPSRRYEKGNLDSVSARAAFFFFNEP